MGRGHISAHIAATYSIALSHVRSVRSCRAQSSVAALCTNLCPRFQDRVSHQSTLLLFCGGDGVESHRFRKIFLVVAFKNWTLRLGKNLCPRFQDRYTNLRPCCFVVRMVWKVTAFKKCFPLSHSERKFWKGAQEKHFCQKGLPRRQMLKLNKIRKSYQKKVFT